MGSNHEAAQSIHREGCIHPPPGDYHIYDTQCERNGNFEIGLGEKMTDSPIQKEDNDNAIQIAKINAIQAILVALVAIVPSVASYQFGIHRGGTAPSEVGEEVKEPSAGSQESSEKQVIIVMDSHVPKAVYMDNTRDLHGSNTDDISEIIDDIYGLGSIRREATNPEWNRRGAIEAQNPDLVIIHKSAFYDYVSNNTRSDLDKLVSVLSSIAQNSINTRFLVYSTGFCTEGNEDLSKAKEDLLLKVNEYQDLKDAVDYFGVCSPKKWDDDDLKDRLRQKIKDILR